HTVVAAYNGDAKFNSSTNNLAQTVNQASTVTTVSSSGNPSLFGASVTFTGTVSAVSPGVGTRTGTLTFNVDGANQTPVSINASGIGTLAVSGLSTGSHVIAASYSGDTNFAGGTSTNFTQTVNKGSTTTATTSSTNPSVFGQSVTLTATVPP